MLGTYFLGRYFGPFYDAPSATGDGGAVGNSQENTLEYWKGQFEALKAKSDADAVTHATAYNGLQSKLSKKDDELKTLKGQFDETTGLMTTLTAEKTTHETTASKLANENRQLAMELARKKLFLSPEYSHLIEFENQGVIARVDAFNEDGTPNVDAIKETLDKFNLIYLGNQEKVKKGFKQGEVPPGPPPENKARPSSVLLAEAQALQRAGKVQEFQAKMIEYRAAKEIEDKNK